MWDACCGIIIWFHTFSQNSKAGGLKLSVLFLLWVGHIHCTVQCTLPENLQPALSFNRFQNWLKIITVP